MRKLKLFALFLVIGFAVKANGNTDSNYVEEHVTLHTATGDIFGTLLLPAKFKKIPVALLIAGSGPTDRDGNNPMAPNACLKMLAYALVDKNIATLRYDKRGIGQSMPSGLKEEDLRFTTYVSDAKDWVDLLKKDKRFTSVTIIGHSEGSLIGMMASAHADKYVSVAGAGQAADTIIRRQMDGQSQEVKDMIFPRFDSLKRGDTLVDVPKILYSLLRPSIQRYMISWFAVDPQVEIKKVTIPTLLVQGTNDLQVTVDDANLLKKAKPDAELVLVKNMNHVFRIVEGDQKANIKTYYDGKLPIAAELPEAIIAFINK
jgi:uncharacterized protein